jgi:hypothetical protein
MIYKRLAKKKLRLRRFEKQPNHLAGLIPQCYLTIWDSKDLHQRMDYLRYQKI